jgi:hypothetical protein
LTLVPSKDDVQFSAEYQSELKSFSNKAHITTQRYRTRDGLGEIGREIGEYFFNHSSELITALSAYGVAWLNGRSNRKLHLKFRDIEIEANNTKEIEVMIKLIRELENS